MGKTEEEGEKEAWPHPFLSCSGCQCEKLPLPWTGPSLSWKRLDKGPTRAWNTLFSCSWNPLLSQDVRAWYRSHSHLCVVRLWSF